MKSPRPESGFSINRVAKNEGNVKRKKRDLVGNKESFGQVSNLTNRSLCYTVNLCGLRETMGTGISGTRFNATCPVPVADRRETTDEFDKNKLKAILESK